jgi:hypothetical protein
MRVTRRVFASGGSLSLLIFALAAPGSQASWTSPALQDPACVPSGMPLEGRASPYDSASVALGEGTIKICYGRPSARGRTMIGGDDVPFGEPWRTGANEPTVLHTTVPIRVAGISLEPGSYSLYTRPGRDEWQLFVNRSTDRWGIPIDAEVRAQDVDSAILPRERPPEHVETLTIRFGSETDGAVPMVLEWEEFRVTVPIEAGS